MDEEAAALNREANIKETIRFWRAWKTVHQMCQDRVCDTAQTLPSFLVLRKQALRFLRFAPFGNMSDLCDEPRG